MFVDPSGSSFISWFFPAMEPLIKSFKILIALLENIFYEKTVLTIAQTLYGETGGRYVYDDWQDGMLAVATVISNRKKHDDYPNSFIEVCTQPSQFVGYSRGKDAYEDGSCDEIMWDYAITVAWDMVKNGGVMHPSLNSRYIYFHSELYGDEKTIADIKNKPETLIFGGNMFYINYG